MVFLSPVCFQPDFSRNSKGFQKEILGRSVFHSKKREITQYPEKKRGGVKKTFFESMSLVGFEPTTALL